MLLLLDMECCTWGKNGFFLVQVAAAQGKPLAQSRLFPKEPDCEGAGKMTAVTPVQVLPVPTVDPEDVTFRK